MLKKSLKVLAIIVTMWLISCLTIVREFSMHRNAMYRSRNIFETKDLDYEKALDKFRMNYDNDSTGFRGEIEHLITMKCTDIPKLVLSQVLLVF